jgi:hypothetical protein
MTCRVGKGADHERMLLQACKRSAVPTQSHIQLDAKDRVGTAHERSSFVSKALPAPLPTLRRCSLWSAA